MYHEELKEEETGIVSLLNQYNLAQNGELRHVKNGHYLAFIGGYIMDVELYDANNFKVNRTIPYNIPLRYLID